MLRTEAFFLLLFWSSEIQNSTVTFPVGGATSSSAAAPTCSSSLPDPRFSTSISKQRDRKARKTGDSFSGLWSSGVPLVAIKYRAYDKNNIFSSYTYIQEHQSQRLLTLRGFSLRYGGSPSTISIAMMPRDQMSTFGPYAFLVTTSGAIQYGVPTMVLRLLCSGVIWAQKPKSAAEKKRISCLFVHDI